MLTYGTLEREVNRFANALRSLGVAKGDRVGYFLYGHAVLESHAMLACENWRTAQRSHSGDFLWQSCANGSTTLKAKVAITCDGAVPEAASPLKASVDEALRALNSERRCGPPRRRCGWKPPCSSAAMSGGTRSSMLF